MSHFYEFLNIYKILKILREQNIVRFQRPKITSDTWFQTEKDIPRWKAISRLSKYAFKTLGNIGNEFWERKVHGAFKWNLTFPTWQRRGSERHKSILQQMFKPKHF